MKVEHMPALYLIPAFHKKPPFIYYEGRGKVYDMMLFIEKYVDVYIELPNNPHLTAEEIIEYRKQMEREGKTSEL